MLLSKITAAVIYINNCGILDKEGETYVLTSNVFSGTTCFYIKNKSITLDCDGYTIQGLNGDYGIYTRLSSGTGGPVNGYITVKNCKITGWKKGVYFYNTNKNTFQNLDVYSNDYGIYLYDSDENQLNYSRINSNTEGLYLDWGSWSNEIKNSRILSNNIGVEINWGAKYNKFYNNEFKNSVNYKIGKHPTTSESPPNHWNTTRQIGERIYSLGNEIGGNYWTNLMGNGYSDTCEDNDCDGFCDEPYNITNDGKNTDFLPLSNKYDTTLPTYCCNSTSVPYAGFPVSFSVKLFDNCAGLKQYEFWLDNCTNHFQKINTGSISGLSRWLNLTFTINSTVGCRVRWYVRASDKNGNWGRTDTFTFYTVQPPYLEVNISNPPSYYEVLKGEPFKVSASVTCRGYKTSCRKVFATIRYNKSSPFPDTPISTAESAQPFYTLPSSLKPFNYSCEGFCSCIGNAFDGSNSSGGQLWNSNPPQPSSLNFTFIVSSSQGILFVRTKATDEGNDFNSYVRIYNFTSNSWYVWLKNFGLEDYTIDVNKSSGLISQAGEVILNFYINSTDFDVINIYETYLTSSVNTFAFEVLEENQTWNVSWEIVATGDINTYWNVDVIFNSTSSSGFSLEDNTEDSLIKIIPGILVVEISYPSQEFINVSRYSNFTITGRAICIEGNCERVTATIKYNTSSISDDPNAIPFYTSLPTKLCSSNLNGGSNCLVSWEINATGEKYTDWKIYITFNSDSVGEKNTTSKIVKIFPERCSREPFIIDGKLRIMVECEGEYYSHARSRETFNMPISLEAFIIPNSSLKNWMIGFGNGTLDGYGRPENALVFEFNETHVRFVKYSNFIPQEFSSIEYGKKIEKWKEFFEGWESGSISSNWTTYSSTPQGRIQVPTSYYRSGNYGLTMDVSSSGTLNLNEIITNYDFSGANQIILTFWHRETNDEQSSGADHNGHYNSDAYYFTCDGNHWYHLGNLGDVGNTWTKVKINITADPDWCPEINSSFKIKITQYDNYPISTDGRMFDDINISYLLIQKGSISSYQLRMKLNYSNITFLVNNQRFEFPLDSSINDWYFFTNAYDSKDTIVDIDNITIRKYHIPEPEFFLSFSDEERIEVKRLGLASNEDKPNLLSLKKIRRLNEICSSQEGYNSLKARFGLEAEFYLIIKRIEDNSLLLTCGLPQAGEPSAYVERIVALDDGSYGKLELRVWK